jgi:hypothetical protein
MYITDLFAISPQYTFNLEFEKGNWKDNNEKYYSAIEPNYATFIPTQQLRRMGKAVKMGIGAALPLLNRNKQCDGIIIGTANGGMEDCILFLNQIQQYAEGLLTPTNFVQSTPNALAGQLAIATKNTGYNMTHVNGSLSFENAILDAFLFFDEQTENSSLLVGAVEEISTYNYNIDLLAGRFKQEIMPNNELLNSTTDGSVCGEGAAMFVVSNSEENSLAQIIDVSHITTTKFEDLEELLAQFLSKNSCDPTDIDLLILGRNGDARHEKWYDHFARKFESSACLGFKQLCGEYRTASAFACYLAAQILSTRWPFPTSIRKAIPQKVRYILIYNHFDGERHGLILLKSPR